MKLVSRQNHLNYCSRINISVILRLILNLIGEALGAIGDTSVIPLLDEYSKDSTVEVAETCELALQRLKWIDNAKTKEENLSENPYASVDPAPPAETRNVKELTDVLMDESASLFDRYRAMFSLRNLRTEESVLALGKGQHNIIQRIREFDLQEIKNKKLCLFW